MKEVRIDYNTFIEMLWARPGPWKISLDRERAPLYIMGRNDPELNKDRNFLFIINENEPDRYYRIDKKPTPVV